MAVSVPVTALFIFTFNILLIQVGAADISGAGAGIAVITQIGPINTVLVIAGAVSTAICADLGARTIREEIDAMEVLGIDPIHRLVVPRVLACALCGMLLNALVSMVGLVGGFLFGVYMQNVSAGAYLATLTLRHRPARSRHRDDQGAGLRAHRRTGRLLPRADRERRFQGSGHRRQRNRGAVRGRAVRGQRGADHHRCAVRNGDADMSTAPGIARPLPAGVRHLRRYGDAATRPLDEAGKIGWFAIIGVRDMVWAFTRYRKEILRLIAEVGMGTGAMAVIGGTAVIIGFVTMSAGSLVAIQGLRVVGPHRY